ncbi:hypothetical protein BSKO_05463 [Bryopsis sp. KO-2023]|nr:hypothetical protein BSKO_05463 [Bryopsis sp. KO-2023]
MSSLSQTAKTCSLGRSVATQRVVPRSCSRLTGCRAVLPGGARPITERRDVTVAASAVEPYVSEEPEAGAAMDMASLKAALLDSLFGLDRGLNARGEARAEMNELIGQLEACNPTPSPTEASAMLSGNWKLVYTSSPEVLALMNLSKLPLVKIGDITQKIDGPGMTVENKIQVTVPFSRTSFSTSASFEVSSPKRLRLQYTSGNVATPELLEDIDLPNEVSVMGQSIDLSQLKTALQPLNSTVKDAVAQLGNILAQQPDLKIPIQNDRAPVTWLLTTYLDGDTRISRGDGGTVYVLVKDVSLEDAPPVDVEVEGEVEPEVVETSEGTVEPEDESITIEETTGPTTPKGKGTTGY